ncbi:MAG: hypothetical protein JWO06_222 [Bacteroidota bacterium]|nr:hypothetical protein [Bacteroidota bacterium]
MIPLVKHIKESQLRNRLYGFTSMLYQNRLVVTIYNPIDTRQESLHITFNHQNKKWHFEYFAKPFEQPDFVRNYSEEKGIEKFDNFIKMINW